MVTLTIGTGVGGAIVADDRLFRGGFGAGAELGHMRLIPDGLPVRLRRPRLHRTVRLRSARCCAWPTRFADAGGIGLGLAAVRDAERRAHRRRSSAG